MAYIESQPHTMFGSGVLVVLLIGLSSDKLFCTKFTLFASAQLYAAKLRVNIEML